tara:strand:- start:919 stop:1080 length:162 start_codon:yes stop_codon:yes gene_type:complete
MAELVATSDETPEPKKRFVKEKTIAQLFQKQKLNKLTNKMHLYTIVVEMLRGL